MTGGKSCEGARAFGKEDLKREETMPLDPSADCVSSDSSTSSVAPPQSCKPWCTWLCNFLWLLLVGFLLAFIPPLLDLFTVLTISTKAILLPCSAVSQGSPLRAAAGAFSPNSESYCAGKIRGRTFNVEEGGLLVLSLDRPCRSLRLSCLDLELSPQTGEDATVSAVLASGDGHISSSLYNRSTPNKGQLASHGGGGGIGAEGSGSPGDVTFAANRSTTWSLTLRASHAAAITVSFLAIDESGVHLPVSVWTLHQVSSPNAINAVGELHHNVSSLEVLKGSVVDSDEGQGTRDPPEGYGVDSCRWYLSPEARKWLPPAYSRAAYCACRLDQSPIRAANSDSAKCIRSFLLQHHQGTAYISQKEKDLAEELLRRQYQGCGERFLSPLLDADNPTSCTLEYNEAVSDLLVTKIYDMHVDAYAACCCPSEPAGLWAWKLIVESNFQAAHPWLGSCPLVGLAIELFGPCGRDDW